MEIATCTFSVIKQYEIKDEIRNAFLRQDNISE